MQVFLIRRVAITEYGTFGVIITGGVPFALTLEREWLNNMRNVSCIPKGTYYCKRVDSAKFGDTFEIQDVPNRSHILFHKGNLEDDSHGCVLIGEQFENLEGVPGILASRKGFDEFMEKLEGETAFELHIIEHF